MRLQHYTIFGLIAAPAICIYLGAPWWVTALAVFVILNVLAIGAIFIRLNLFLVALHKGNSTTEIALTFDDGPTTITPQILDVLKREGVPAAFFSIGERAAAAPQLVKRWDEEGHLVGNHSYGHGFFYDFLPAYRMVTEMEKTNLTVQDIIGKKPLLFRPPYGVTNPAVARSVRQLGMTAIGWSIRSFDTKAKSAEALTERVCSRLKGGDIILLHDSIAVTAEALTAIIQTARKAGFTFVRVDKLLNIQPYA